MGKLSQKRWIDVLEMKKMDEYRADIIWPRVTAQYLQGGYYRMGEKTSAKAEYLGLEPNDLPVVRVLCPSQNLMPLFQRKEHI